MNAALALADRIKKLHAIDLEGGERIGICSHNSDLLLLVYAACFLRGFTIVPINPGESDHAIARILEHAKCRLLITEKARQSVPCPTSLMTDLFSDGSHRGADRSDHELGQTIAAEDPAAIFYTSGTTSAPKGVVLSHRAILANAAALQTAHQLNRQSIHYCILPLYHVNAFGFSFLTVLAARSQLVLSHRFQPDHFWRILVAESCQTCNVVPEVVSQLIAKSMPDPALLQQARQTIRYFVSAASTLSRDLWLRFTGKSAIKLVQGYGLSETVNFALLVSPFVPDDEFHTAMLDAQRPSAGAVISGNDVMVRRLADDQPCEIDEIGEIVVRGWNVMSAYLDNPSDTASVFRNGWFCTGDLGYCRMIANKKYFYISGRLKEIVKRKSETIYVQEVEEILQTIPGCAVAAVTGFPNRWTGEEIGAVIVKEQATPDSEAILIAARELLGYDKSPKVVRFVKEIPRTGSMKVKRGELSTLFVDLESTKFSR